MDKNHVGQAHRYGSAILGADSYLGLSVKGKIAIYHPLLQIQKASLYTIP